MDEEKTPLLYGNQPPSSLNATSTTNHSDVGGVGYVALKHGTKETSITSSVITYHDISYTVKGVKFEGQKIDKEIIKRMSFRLHGLNNRWISLKSVPKNFTDLNNRWISLKSVPKTVGNMKPGANAILGPTGSGKTTLLDILAGRKDRRHLSGTVLVNGKLQPDNFKCATGYVVQDDVIMGTLTVRENLSFSAALRLPKSHSKKERKERVNEILLDLGIMGVADQKVGTEFIRGISGGERKRTSIGMELITSPSVLFLDEPTTGLDASTACSVMQLLHALGKRGKTVIFSIHQPRYSIYKLFDTMTMLSEGDIVYQGPRADALQYFESIGYTCEEHNNPPDFFMDVIHEKELYQTSYIINSSDIEVAHAVQSTSYQRDNTNMAKLYRKSKYFTQIQSAIQPIYREFIETSVDFKDVEQVDYATGFFTQLYHVSGRAVKNLLRNPHTSIMQLIITVIFGVIVGAIYYDQKKGPNGLQNRVGAFFFIIMNMVFGNLSAVELFIKERKIFIHESAGGYYRVSVYFLAKVLCDIIPMRLFPTAAFSAIVYFMIGFQRTVLKFVIFFLTLVLTSLCACGLSFFVSASVLTFANANLLIALPYVFMMVFSGVLVNLGSVGKWLSWVKYISIFRYAIESLEANELKGMIFVCPRNISCPSGDQFLEVQDVDPSHLWYNELALAVMTVIYLTFAYIALRLIKKEK